MRVVLRLRELRERPPPSAIPHDREHLRLFLAWDVPSHEGEDRQLLVLGVSVKHAGKLLGHFVEVFSKGPKTRRHVSHLLPTSGEPFAKSIEGHVLIDDMSECCLHGLHWPMSAQSRKDALLLIEFVHGAGEGHEAQARPCGLDDEILSCAFRQNPQRGVEDPAPAGVVVKKDRNHVGFLAHVRACLPHTPKRIVSVAN